MACAARWRTVAPGIDGRFARKHLGSRDLGVSLFRYAPTGDLLLAKRPRLPPGLALKGGD
jgi:hypothetical protein